MPQAVSKSREYRQKRRCVQILIPEDLHRALSAEGRNEGRTVGRQLEAVLRTRYPQPSPGGAS